MHRLLFFVILVFIIGACNFDEVKQQKFAGTYDVTLHSPRAQKELKKAEKNMEEDVSKAQKDVQKSIEQAKEDIANDLGEDSHTGKAVQKIVEGAGKFAEGMAELGEGLGNLGIGLGRGILNGLKFQADFKKNGEAIFGKGISAEDLFWEIKGDQLYLWNEGGENDKKAFTLKNISGNEWELAGDDVTFHLVKKTR